MTRREAFKYLLTFNFYPIRNIFTYLSFVLLETFFIFAVAWNEKFVFLII